MFEEFAGVVGHKLWDVWKSWWYSTFLVMFICSSLYGYMSISYRSLWCCREIMVHRLNQNSRHLLSVQALLLYRFTSLAIKSNVHNHTLSVQQQFMKLQAITRYSMMTFSRHVSILGQPKKREMKWSLRRDLKNTEP